MKVGGFEAFESKALVIRVDGDTYDWIAGGLYWGRTNRDPEDRVCQCDFGALEGFAEVMEDDDDVSDDRIMFLDAILKLRSSYDMVVFEADVAEVD